MPEEVEEYQEQQNEERYVTWKGFIVAIVPLLVILMGAQMWIVRVHAELPYHVGVIAIAYEKSKGEVLEARLSRMEVDVKEIKTQIEQNNQEIQDLIKDLGRELRQGRRL